tara:strand:+ start:774 stop:1673 length:900 start_codon:yes stop_codon:yes gene_type:complete
MKKIKKIMVPASSANLGSGFDSIGLCLDLWNEIEFHQSKFKISISGEGTETINKDKNNLIYQSYLKTSEILNTQGIDLSINCINSIPTSGGLGSSSSAVIAGIMIAFSINQIDIEKNKIYQIASQIEGHPDNVGPAIFGGITIGFKDKNNWHINQIPFPKDLKIVSFVSKQKVLTDDSRKKLPDNISRKDAVYNISRVATLVNSLNNSHYNELKYSVQDAIHEQYRINSIKGFKLISDAAKNAGALATYLSGSGPTISAITNNKEVTINYEMLEAASRLNIDGKGFINNVSYKGAHIIE